MNFSELEHMAKPTLEKIIALPFNMELANGTLPLEKFIFYLQQDALYLTDFSKALAITATKLPTEQLTQRFLSFSQEALNAESMLHKNYLSRYQDKFDSDVIQSPSCFMYTNYLLQTASVKSVEEAVASLLPCFWIYYEVALHIVKLSKAYSNNPYQEWIDLYSSDAFATSTNLAIETLDELMTQASHRKEKVKQAFMQSTKLEWLFWDSAYRMERWSV